MFQFIQSTLDYETCAIAARLLFVAAFAGIVWACSSWTTPAVERFASIPLCDEVRDPRDGQ